MAEVKDMVAEGLEVTLQKLANVGKGATEAAQPKQPGKENQQDNKKKDADQKKDPADALASDLKELKVSDTKSPQPKRAVLETIEKADSKASDSKATEVKSGDENKPGHARFVCPYHPRSIYSKKFQGGVCLFTDMAVFHHSKNIG